MEDMKNSSSFAAVFQRFISQPASSRSSALLFLAVISVLSFFGELCGYTVYFSDPIKKIYKLRWGIETSFCELKYHVGLIAFHSKKKDCMIQEIFASLIMYNFSMLITENILIDDDKHNKYRYSINCAIAVFVCINFFRSDHVNPSHLEKLIARNKYPVRPDRNSDRITHYHSAIAFNYRLS